MVGSKVNGEGRDEDEDEGRAWGGVLGADWVKMVYGTWPSPILSLSAYDTSESAQHSVGRVYRQRLGYACR